jgi:hypothetical protein
VGWTVLGSNPGGGRDFSHKSRPALRPSQPPVLYNGYRVFPWVKRPGRVADHPPLLAPKSRMSRAIPLLLPRAFRACYRANFTFYMTSRRFIPQQIVPCFETVLYVVVIVVTTLRAGWSEIRIPVFLAWSALSSCCTWKWHKFLHNFGRLGGLFVYRKVAIFNDFTSTVVVVLCWETAMCGILWLNRKCKTHRRTNKCIWLIHFNHTFNLVLLHVSTVYCHLQVATVHLLTLSLLTSNK